ncbi:MAG: aspartate aminotransferase family protein [Verrucomicrobia bacterium]|nr:aspartate aminotransferase family protein [Verrucomicrobiota bacterium]
MNRAARSSGMRSPRVLRLLGEFESPNVTHIEPDGSWPIVWERARDCEVWDAEGRRYLDLTAAFGVAAAGHANPAVVRAAQGQLARLPHAMGDVHPHPLKAELARELSRVTFERWTARHAPRLTGKVIFTNSGFEAVEAALKTALLATRRPGVVAFTGAYHGLGYGALTATHREHFREPFRRQLARFTSFVEFPTRDDDLPGMASAISETLRTGKFGAVLVEPMQARGGIRIPPAGFLAALRELCDRHRALLVVDEIYTGFGRTGRWFACEHAGVVPDLICLGKALTGGFPLSACVGRAELMDRAWPKSSGEAIHTSTFLGNPVGCAMALAQMAEIRRRRLVQRSQREGHWLLRQLQAMRVPGLELRARGAGLMAGLEVRRPDGEPATGVVLRVVKRMLAEGFILLPEGAEAEVIGFTPPLTITRPQLAGVVKALEKVLREPEGT